MFIVLAGQQGLAELELALRFSRMPESIELKTFQDKQT